LGKAAGRSDCSRTEPPARAGRILYHTGTTVQVAGNRPTVTTGCLAPGTDVIYGSTGPRTRESAKNQCRGL